MKKIVFALLFLPLFSVAQGLYFPPNSGTTWATTDPQTLGWCQENIDSLYFFLEENNTKAFILLKDGKIVLEKYLNGHTQNSSWYWASAGKTLTAFMVGVAQQEGFLSISDTTSDYLGQGWTSCSPTQEEKITIKHQLSMTTGLDDAVPDNHCTLDSCLIYEADAGTRWSYHNAPYTLLDSVIEIATGQTLNNYITQKLKNPTGMTGAFFKIDYNNVFLSTARSMARFGLLLLNKGNWNGTQIMTDTAYFQAMTSPSQNINPAYGYLTWLNGSSNYMIPQTQLVLNGQMSPHAPADMIAAMGKNGQFINVVPSQNLVWVRMGDAPDNSLVPFLLNDEIWEYINELSCIPNETKKEEKDNLIAFFPNPVQDVLNIQSNKMMLSIEIYDLKGQKVKTIFFKNEEKSVNFSDLSSGVWFAKINFSDGKFVVQKVVKN
jgi:CubicO group peptidase (beta-lactamase class C family)